MSNALRSWPSAALPEMLTSLAGFLSVLGIEAYLVGGAVRDMLLDREVT